MRYAALLRGVSPLNAKMPALVKAFEWAGFGDVRTVIGSGNVLFTAPKASEQVLAKKAEQAMKDELGRVFTTYIRSVDALRALIEADAFAAWKLAKGAKRVITFLRAAPTETVTLPKPIPEAAIHAVIGREVYSSYVSGPKGPVFMSQIEKTFGHDVTTRTWDTIRKLAA